MKIRKIFTLSAVLLLLCGMIVSPALAETRIDGVKIGRFGKLFVDRFGDNMAFSLDGTDGFVKWSDGKLKLDSSESASADTRVQIGTVTTGTGDLLIGDGSNANYYIDLVQQDAESRIDIGSAVTNFIFNNGNVDVDMQFKSSVATGYAFIPAD